MSSKARVALLSIGTILAAGSLPQLSRAQGTATPVGDYVGSYNNYPQRPNADGVSGQAILQVRSDGTATLEDINGFDRGYYPLASFPHYATVGYTIDSASDTQAGGKIIVSDPDYISGSYLFTQGSSGSPDKLGASTTQYDFPDHQYTDMTIYGFVRAAAPFSLSGDAAVTAPVLQTSGTTSLDHTLTITGDAPDYVVEGGTLGGNGTISGNLVVGAGTVSPGHSPGTLTVIRSSASNTGNYTQSSGGTLLEQLGGASGGAYDVLNVVNQANLDGTLSISLVNGFRPAVGDQFTFLNYGLMLGGFQKIVSLDSGYGYDVAYNDHSAILTVTSAAPAPEPSPSAALGLGALSLAALALKARKRRVEAA